jgi:site-specific DNA-cytosine methylase
VSLIPFIDCSGLAGAWTLGTVQTGEFELVHRVSENGGFGDATVERNRHLLPGNWQIEEGLADGWTPGQAGFLCGTPPCAGFSSLNTQGEKGAGAKQNACMHRLIEYAGRCAGMDGKRGPEIVGIESVQPAFSKGRPLFHMLWDKLDDLTGQDYEMHHVLMSGASVGAAQMRHRYFAIWARVPFGVDPPERSALPDGRVVTYRDAIQDLRHTRVTWDAQPYPTGNPLSVYAARLGDDSGLVSGMQTAGGNLSEMVTEAASRGWEPGTFLSEAFDALDYHPPRADGQRREGGLRRGTSTYKGLNWPYRVKPDQPGYVLAGSCARDFVHWQENRLLTVRELSRLMGYPDAWQWAPKVTVASAELGKCCPVPSGQWISTWAARALNGEPGQRGRVLNDGEFVYPYTRAYKEWL